MMMSKMRMMIMARYFFGHVRMMKVFRRKRMRMNRSRMVMIVDNWIPEGSW